MKLLQQFSLTEIVVFIILFTLALKSLISTIDWFKKRGEKFFYENHQKPKQIQETLKEITDSIEKLNKSVEMLIDSDKDAIKAYITEKHHYFCYNIKEIDLQSLDCIEKRYSHYQEQGGNSYVKDLMMDLRRLPKQNLRKQE